MNDATRIVTVRGSPLAIGASWLVVFALFLWSFAASSHYPSRCPGWAIQACDVAGLSKALPFFAAIIAHKLGHAPAVARFGVRTRRRTRWPIGGLAGMACEPAPPRSWP